MAIISILYILSAATVLVSAMHMDDYKCMRYVMCVAFGVYFATLISLMVIDNITATCLQYQEECTELLKSLIKS